MAAAGEIIERENMTVYLSPNAVHRMFTVIMEYQPFENECINRNVCQRMLHQDDNNILMSNQEYIWQLYVRYLSCNGRVNSLFDMLQMIQRNVNEDQNQYAMDSFEMFLNRVDVPGFEGDTILDTFIAWNNDDISVERFIELGATSHIRVDTITNVLHHRPWSNPFANIMRIPGFPSFERNRVIQQHDIRERMNNGVRIHNNATIERHVSHFYNSVIGMLRRNNRDNYDEQEVLNQIVLNNPDIDNDYIQNNDIVIE